MHDLLAGDHSLKNEPLKAYYVNSGANTSAPTSDSNSAKFFDLGLFQMATSGNAVTTEVGELYVTYSFTMIRPKQQTPSGQNLIAAHYAFVPTNTSAFAGSSQRAGSNLSITFTNTSLSIPTIGRYVLTYSAVAATSFTKGGNLTASTNVTFLSQLNNNGNSFLDGGNATTQYVCTVMFDVTAVGGIITWAAPTIVGAANADLNISLVSSGLALRRSPEMEFHQEAEILALEAKVNRMSLLLERLLGAGDDYCEIQETTPVARSFRPFKLP
jgi:hypothetical protein